MWWFGFGVETLEGMSRGSQSERADNWFSKPDDRVESDVREVTVSRSVLPPEPQKNWKSRVNQLLAWYSAVNWYDCLFLAKLIVSEDFEFFKTFVSKIFVNFVFNKRSFKYSPNHCQNAFEEACQASWARRCLADSSLAVPCGAFEVLPVSAAAGQGRIFHSPGPCYSVAARLRLLVTAACWICCHQTKVQS